MKTDIRYVIGENEVGKIIDSMLCDDDTFVKCLLEGATEFEKAEFFKEFPECMKMIDYNVCFA